MKPVVISEDGRRHFTKFTPTLPTSDFYWLHKQVVAIIRETEEILPATFHPDPEAGLTSSLVFSLFLFTGMVFTLA